MLASWSRIWYNIGQIYSSKGMRVSVIIPCYNLVSYVDATLESVSIAARRFCGELEVICVDDGSVDGTGEKLEGWRGRFGAEGRVRYEVLHQENGGEGAARNAGLGVVTGDWVTFLDGDDLWGEWILKAAEELIRAHSDVDIVNLGFGAFEDGEAAECIRGVKWEEKKCRVYETGEEVQSEVLLGVGVYPTFFRREKFFDEKFSGLTLGADRLYVAQCLAKADEVVMDERVVHGYRLRAGSMAHLEWSAKKVGSMLDYAEGAMGALVRSGKRLGVEGVRYLCDVMMGVARKQIGRMKDVGERREAARKWIGVLRNLDVAKVPRKVRLMRAWYLFVAGRMLKGASK